MVTVLLAPAGASLTGVTLTVIVLGDRIEIHAAVGRAAVVLHLEGEAGVARAVGIRGRRELQHAGRDVGHRNELPGGHGHAVIGERAGRRQRRDLHGQQVVGRRVVGVAEAEVGGRERVGRVFQRGDRLVVPAGASLTGVTLTVIVLGDWIEIDAAIGRAAVVLHLEGEAGVARRRWHWRPA